MTTGVWLVALALVATDAGQPDAGRNSTAAFDAGLPDGGTGRADATPVGDDRVKRFAHYVAWLLDLCLSEAQLAQAAQQVERADSGKDLENKKLVDRIIELDAELEKETPAELARLRPSVADEYLKRLSRKYKGRPAATWILGLSAGSKRKPTGQTPVAR
jgi:hypothetical protein